MLKIGNIEMKNPSCFGTNGRCMQLCIPFNGKRVWRWV